MNDLRLSQMRPTLSMFYSTERHLHYVACTRARDHLLVTCTAPASEVFDCLEPPLRREQGLAAKKSRAVPSSSRF
jgi:ATP-dependent exoDNAse (exonuclease V) beta subunit